MPATNLAATHSVAALLLISHFTSCQVTDAIAEALRPDERSTSLGPGDFTSPGPAGDDAGLEGAEGVEVIQHPTSAELASYARLIEARLGLPARPTPPLAPRLVPVDAESAVNTPVQLSTNGGGAAALAAGTTARGRVAVVSGDDLGRVAALNAVPNFVADVFYGRLQRRGVTVIDCEYAPEGNHSSAAPVESSARRGDTSTSHREMRAGAARATELGADHLIVLHAVPLPMGTGGLAARSIALPLEVDPVSWSSYEESAQAYLADVAAYNAAVEDYEALCLEVLAALGTRVVRLESRDLPKTIRDERALRALKTQVESLLATPEPSQAPEADPFAWFEQLLLENAELEAETRPELLEAALRERGSKPYVEVRSREPRPIIDPERRLFRTRDEALLERLPERIVDAFEFAVSVRVIDLRSSGAEWFGAATCRDLSLTAAVERTCDALIEAMLRQ